ILPSTTLFRSSTGTTIDFWHLLTGPDGQILTTMLDEFIQQNPDLTVNQTVLAWGAPYYTKLAMASVGGRAPDAGIMHVAGSPGTHRVASWTAGTWTCSPSWA